MPTSMTMSGRRDKADLNNASVEARKCPERPFGLRAACRVLPPALLPLTIILAAARARISRLGVRIALENEAEEVVAVAARNEDIGGRPARHKAAPGVVVHARDELRARDGLAAQRR